ncbi:MAG TPA: sn-glycerol-3-phosphate ABC transporter ATP-binding protein UgpC [Thermoleophilaceae bacterium]|nr:sn-glycerol-3-phosphate ABC transporter ATP-binding protein UgpC [Thermoleophilaceae bacterium]
MALKGARKAFPTGVEALAGVDLDVRDGELMVLVGPSGCGKTTALRAIAGLERLSAGRVEIDGADVGHLEPAERDVAMVFQNYALYPNMSVARNISFGLRARGASREEQERRVSDIAKVLDIEALLDRKPRMLSGGQRQRVAMGRAIVRDPRVFLMDEPLSNLDARLRVQMRGEIVRIQRELGTTTVYVTHDQVEAMTMGQRVAVMDSGRVRQCDTPARLYDAPADAFVARFMGSPPMNLLDGRIEAVDGGGLAAVLGTARLPLSSAQAAARPALRSYAGREIAVGVRPDGFEIGPADGRGDLTGVVYLAEMLGSEALIHVELEHVGARITGRFGGRPTAAPGDRVSVAVDPARLDFFDAATGIALDRDGRG